MGNDCWYYRAQYAGMTKVCMRKSTVERGRIVRFGLCAIPPDSEAWRRCGFAIGQVETAQAVRRRQHGKRNRKQGPALREHRGGTPSGRTADRPPGGS